MVGDLNILVVDDESGLADLYTVWLSDNHDVDTAYSGEEAMEKVDGDTDIVFLDRRMPQMSGDEVLAAIREQDFDCQVAMVTGVNADFDIIDIPFDDYLSKPVSEDDIEAVIERLHRRSAYDDALQSYFSLVSRQATLQADRVVRNFLPPCLSHPRVQARETRGLLSDAENRYERPYEKQPEQLAGNNEYTELLDKIERRKEELDSLTDQLDEGDVNAFFAEF